MNTTTENELYTQQETNDDLACANWNYEGCIGYTNQPTDGYTTPKKEHAYTNIVDIIV